jgi:hypothetical protein
MIYNQEAMLRCYEALDANLDTESFILEMLTKVESFKDIDGEFTLSSTPVCMAESWSCQTTAVFIPTVSKAEVPAACSKIMKFFDIQLEPWTRREVGWELIKSKRSQWKTWRRSFTIEPESRTDPIRLVVMVYEETGDVSGD